MTNRSSADADCEHHEINSISDDDATGTNDKKDCEKRLSAIHALEAKAVAKASAAADNRFIPSASLMNSNDPYAIIGQVDGLADLSDYDENESVYVGTSVPISAGGCLEIPIQVATPGSIVHYSVENKKYDFAFSITAERDHTITLVKEDTRVDASSSNGPITGKFLVGTAPCWIRFKFDNEYSWVREKVVSYKVTVKPPSLDILRTGRHRRAKSCLKAISDEIKTAESRRKAAAEQVTMLESEIEELKLELEQKMKSLEVAKYELKYCAERLKLRAEQQSLLDNRLKNGWDDEIGTEQSHEDKNDDD